MNPQRTDHPPSTDDSARRTAVRRAVIGGIAGVALLVGPVALANVVIPDDSGDDRVEAAAESQTSMIALQRSANQADLAKGSAALSLRTTTTPPPPPPPTEPPPPTTEAPTTTEETAPPETEPILRPRRRRRTPVVASGILRATRPGTHSPIASPGATGPPTPATATTAACSSRPARGTASGARACRTRTRARPRSSWASDSRPGPAGASGRRAAGSWACADGSGRHETHPTRTGTATRGRRFGAAPAASGQRAGHRRATPPSRPAASQAGCVPSPGSWQTNRPVSLLTRRRPPPASKRAFTTSATRDRWWSSASSTGGVDAR